MIRAKVTNQKPREGIAAPLGCNAQPADKRAGITLAKLHRLIELGEGFIERVIEAIEIDTETLSLHTARTRARSANAFLAHVNSDSSSEAEKIRAIIRFGNPATIDPETAHALELSYRNELANDFGAGSSNLAARISNTNVVLRLLASRGLWPHTVRLAPEPIDKNLSSPRLSLLESLGAAKKTAIDLRDPESRLQAALGGLQKLAQPIPQNQEELSSALLDGERICLSLLRSAASQTFERNYAAWSSMQPLIELATRELQEELNEWLEMAIAKLPDGRSRPLDDLTSKLFPSNLLGLSRFLALQESFYMNGESSRFFKLRSDLRAPMSKRFRSVAYRVSPALAELNLAPPHDLHRIRGLLSTSREAVGAASVLLLAETGMNSTPTIELLWDQVRKTNDSRWISIASWKARARGTLIEEELELSKPGEQTSAGSALLKIREMSARHLNFVGYSNSTEPFVFSYASGHTGEAEEPKMSRLTPVIFRAWFHSIATSEFGKDCRITPSSVRPSLLMTTRGHSSSIRNAQLTAGHKSPDTTLKSYAGEHRSAHHFDQMHSIREFQERLQQIAIYNLDGSFLNEDVPVSLSRFEDAINTGLGVLCLRTSGLSGGDSKGCLSIESCPGCSRVQISTNPNDLADLLAFGDHLAQHEKWLQTYRPESWLTRWLPWSLLVDEVQRRGSRSTWAPSLKKALEMKDSRTPPSFPPLW